MWCFGNPNFSYMNSYYSWIVGILFPTICFAQSSINGNWKGELAVAPGNSIALGFDFKSIDRGIATMDSPQQGAFGLPCEVLFHSSDSVAIAMDNIGMKYEARLDGDKLVGKFSQRGFTVGLDLERGSIELHRPQTPVPPFDYHTEDISFRSEDAGGNICGTLTLPKLFSDSTPLVVMVSGSGLQNRDEEIFGHKPFAVIADYLARNGIGSLRYDDRGCAMSAGNGTTATTENFARDAAAAIGYLRSRFAGNKIGLLGHSEGGQIAFMLAGNKALGVSPSFIATIGAPAMRGDSLLAEQSCIYLKSAGVDSTVCADYRKAVLKLYDMIRKDGAEYADKHINSICPGWEYVMQYAPLKSNLKAICKQINPWILYTITYSPQSDIANTTCPTLSLYGAKDSQVPPINASRMKELNPNVEVMVLDGHNHLMQHCSSGAVAEYGLIQETISEEALTRLAEFINTAGR